MRTRLRTALLLPIVAVSLALGATGGVTAQGDPSAVKIGFSLPALDEYYSVVAENASNYAATKGYTLLQGNGVSGGDPSIQIAKVQDLLAQGINVLLISPQSEALQPVLDTAVAQGVKVIFIDQQIPGYTKAEGFIGTDNPKGSALMGNYLAQKLGGTGKVGVLVGSPGIPVSVARTDELQKILEAAGVQVILSSQQDLCQADVAVGVVQNMLVANPDLNAFYTICGPDGLAVDKVLGDQPGDRKYPEHHLGRAGPVRPGHRGWQGGCRDRPVPGQARPDGRGCRDHGRHRRHHPGGHGYRHRARDQGQR